MLQTKSLVLQIKSRLPLSRCLFGLRVQRLSTTKNSDPLRILFCGSDYFSITSLKALYKLQQSDPGLVKSIDVVSRPPKRYGRGLKKIREVPIAQTARDLSLPLHQIDTFTGWELPRPQNEDINLIVAVSFGLLVPPRLINGAKYGGLNVHPSLLPKYRGAAPIQWALINNEVTTGVTLQTLHPSKMDHGKILLQKSGLQVPAPGGDLNVVEALTNYLAPIGAELLVKGIKQGRHVPPVEDLTPSLSEKELKGLPLAPKITKEHRRIRWNEWTAADILRRQTVMGPLWNNISYIDSDNVKKRVIWSQGFTLDSSIDDWNGLQNEIDFGSQRELIGFRTIDSKTLKVKSMKLEGESEQKAGDVKSKIGSKPFEILRRTE